MAVSKSAIWAMVVQICFLILRNLLGLEKAELVMSVPPVVRVLAIEYAQMVSHEMECLGCSPC